MSSKGRIEVKISKGTDLTWLVWLGDLIVGRYMIVGDALAYAQILECNPRIRSEAVAA